MGTSITAGETPIRTLGAMKNPYINQAYWQLYYACQQRAGALLRPAPGKRTAQERAWLATDTGYLLLAIAKRFNQSEAFPGDPRKRATGGNITVGQAFGEQYALEAKAARGRALQDAADFVLGGRAQDWLRGRYREAVESDEAMQAALAQLEALRER